MAHSYIDAIASAGADAVKFQCHIASAESHPDEPWRVEPKWMQDLSRFDYWHRMEFKPHEWAGLREHAENADLEFIVSPFSLEAVSLLMETGLDAWKVASGELTSDALIDAIMATELPVLVSTGMSPWSEIDKAERALDAYPHALLQCTSMYPTPPERVGVEMITKFHTKYACPAGLSDHSGTIWPGLVAAAHGAEVLEVHVVMDRRINGFDSSSSITPDELALLIKGIRFVERMDRVDKDNLGGLERMRELFMGRTA